MSFVNNPVNSSLFPTNPYLLNICAMGGNVYGLDNNGAGLYPRKGSLWRLNGTTMELLVNDESNASNRILSHGSAVIRVDLLAFRGIYSWSSGSAWTQLGTSGSFTAIDAVSVGGTLYVMTTTGVGIISGATFTLVATYSGSGMPVPYGGHPRGYRLVSYAGNVYVIAEDGRLWRLVGSSLVSFLPAPHSDRNLGSTYRGRNPFEVNGVLYYASQYPGGALKNGLLFSYSGSGSTWTTLVPWSSSSDDDFYYDVCEFNGKVFVTAQAGGYGLYMYDPDTSSLVAQAGLGGWESSALLNGRLFNVAGSFLEEFTVYVPPLQGTLKVAKNSTLSIDEFRIYNGTKDLSEYSEFIRALLQ